MLLLLEEWEWVVVWRRWVGGRVEAREQALGLGKAEGVVNRAFLYRQVGRQVGRYLVSGA